MTQYWATFSVYYESSPLPVHSKMNLYFAADAGIRRNYLGSPHRTFGIDKTQENIKMHKDPKIF